MFYPFVLKPEDYIAGNVVNTFVWWLYTMLWQSVFLYFSVKVEPVGATKHPVNHSCSCRSLAWRCDFWRVFSDLQWRHCLGCYETRAVDWLMECSLIVGALDLEVPHFSPRWQWLANPPISPPPFGGICMAGANQSIWRINISGLWIHGEFKASRGIPMAAPSVLV